MSERPNPVDVGRMANELAAEYGLGAHREAMRRAAEAKSAGDARKTALWDAVAERLNPHCSR